MRITNKDLKNHVLSIVADIENGMDSEENQGFNMDGFEYLQDVLDIEWVLNSDKTYKGARVLVAFGGPNIWIDTIKKEVQGYWWGDSFISNYDHDEMGIDDALNELYNC